MIPHGARQLSINPMIRQPPRICRIISQEPRSWTGFPECGDAIYNVCLGLHPTLTGRLRPRSSLHAQESLFTRSSTNVSTIYHARHVLCYICRSLCTVPHHQPMNEFLCSMRSISGDLHQGPLNRHRDGFVVVTCNIILTPFEELISQKCFMLIYQVV